MSYFILYVINIAVKNRAAVSLKDAPKEALVMYTGFLLSAQTWS